MAKILIKNAQCVAAMDNRNTEFSGGHVYIEDHLIRSVGPEDIEVPDARVIDATGHVVLPGFVNTHHHLYQSLTRNIPWMQDLPLFDWLVNHYEVWREISGEAVRISAETGLLELMKSGVTTSSDHLYLFPNRTIPELTDEEIKAAMKLGIRFQPTRGSMSLGRSKGGLPPDDVVQSEQVIRDDTERLLADWHDDRPGAMVRISLAPCSPFSVTEQQMRETAEFASRNRLMIHTHLAETLDEEQFCIREFGHRPVGYMEHLGWLTENAWYAHMVHLNDEEIRQMGEIGVGVSHCPASNMRLGSGIARIREMLQSGLKVSLAVDGSSSNDSGNMLLEIRNALQVSRLRERTNWLTAREVLRMATQGGAAVLGRSDIGSLEPGKCADLALFSLNHLEYAGAMSDPLAALVFTGRMHPVDMLIIHGQIRISDMKTEVDERNLIARHNTIADAMLNRAQKRTGIQFRISHPDKMEDLTG